MTKVSELPLVTSLDGGEYFLITQGGVSKRILADDVAGLALGRALHVTKVPLGDSDAPGGILAWANPEAVPIIVSTIFLLVTTAPAPIPDTENRVLGGVATDPATLDTVLMGLALDRDPVPAIATDGGFTMGLVPVGAAIVLSTQQGSAAGLAGYAYIHYHRA